MNLTQKLQEEKTIQASGTGYFKRAALPEVFAYNKQYRAENPGKYPYNDSIVDFIRNKENISDDLIDILKTQVYLSQQDIRNEAKAIYKEKMLAEGFEVLNKEVVAKAIEMNKRLAVVASMSYDFLTQKIDKVYKPIFHNGQYYLMPARARTRGYSLHSFEDGYCKLV